MSYPKVTEYLHSLTNAISPVLVMCRRGDCIAIVTTERRDMKITNRHNIFVITASIKPQQKNSADSSTDGYSMLLCGKHDLIMYLPLLYISIFMFTSAIVNNYNKLCSVHSPELVPLYSISSLTDCILFYNNCKLATITPSIGLVYS